MSTRQFSVRIDGGTYGELERRSHSVAESRNRLVERYIAEGLKRDDHPLIAFRDGALGRRAALAGARLDVWQVIETLRRHDNSTHATADYLSLPEPTVRAAVRYYADYRAEVDEIAEREQAVAARAEAAWHAEQAVLAE